MKCLILFVVGLTTVLAFPAENTPVEETSMVTDGIDKVYRFLQGCGEKDMSLCIKMRALTFVDRALRRSGDLDLVDGVALVRTDAEGMREMSGRALSEAELDASLPQNADEKDKQVETLLVDRVARFFQSHTLQLKVPDSAINEVRKTMDEARGKKKKQLKMLLPLLLLAKMKAAILLPLALGGLALLALKALVIGKIALVIAGLIAVQKLLHKGHSQSYEVVAHPQYSHDEHSHGHYGRALPADAAVDPQQMAYSAYAKQE